jgi:hypothetical protein
MDQPLSSKEEETFHRTVLKLFISSALPFTLVETNEFKQLIQLIRPAAARVLPSRRQLSSSLLQNEANQSRLENLAAIRKVVDRGVRPALSCDGWMNITKTHILGIVLSAGKESTCYGSRFCGSEHNGVVIAKEMEELIIQIQKDGWNIGSVCTDDAGQCSRARRILQLRHPNIHFESCQAHQMVSV